MNKMVQLIKNDENKTRNKILFFIVFIVLVVLTVGLVSYFSFFQKEDNRKVDVGVRYNTNQSFLRPQELVGLRFDHIKCTFDGEKSIISYDIVNDTSEDIPLKKYEIIIKDVKGNIITTIVFDFDRIVLAQSQENIENEVDVDITDAMTMEIVESKESGDENEK